MKSDAIGVYLKLNPATDSDIIKKLEGKKKQTYIKQLIRDDIRKSGKLEPIREPKKRLLIMYLRRQKTMTNFNLEKTCKGLFKLLNDPRLTGSEKVVLAAALEIIEDKKRRENLDFKGF